MEVTASHLTYYLLCNRKLWLHHQQIRMEDNSDDVSMGKLLDKQAFRRRAKKWRQLDLGALKIDHFDVKTKVVREVKKSPKLEHLHVAQLKLYLFALEQRGVEGVTGLIEYPIQRKTVSVVLSQHDRDSVLQSWFSCIEQVCDLSECPPLEKIPACKNCAFHDFCYC